MQKLGCIICNICRHIIYDNATIIKRKSKKGTCLHFCSEVCSTKDTKQKDSK